MDASEKDTREVKIVEGLVTLILSEDVADKMLASFASAEDEEGDTSSFMLNFGIAGGTRSFGRLNATSTTTSTDPCKTTHVGNGDMLCDADTYVEL